MLGIERPKTRGECLNEARPCPWIACRHHLLIEVAIAKPRISKGRVRDARPTTIRLNRPSRGMIKLGRRSGLDYTDASELVHVWIDEAVEALSLMRYTCSLDVVDDYPDGIPPSGIAFLLGVTEEAIDMELRAGRPKLRSGFSEYEDHEPADHESNLGRMQR
jgi:hypothetical protein